MIKIVRTGASGITSVSHSAVDENIIPDSDDTRDLGSTDKRWAYIYAVIAILTSMTVGGIYLAATTESWFLINASTLINGSLNVTENLKVFGNITGDTYFDADIYLRSGNIFNVSNIYNSSQVYNRSDLDSNKYNKTDVNTNFWNRTGEKGLTGSYLGSFDINTSGNVNISGNLFVDGNTLYVNSSSNSVGIGTTAPSATLEVGSEDALLFNSNGLITPSGLSSNAGGMSTDGGTLQISSAVKMILDFNTRNLDSGGRDFLIQQGASPSFFIDGDTGSAGYRDVGIGTVNPSRKLTVVKTTVANDVFSVQDSSGTCNAQPTTSGFTWSCSSDEKLKENIRISTKSYLDYVANIPLFDYTVKKTGEEVTGWIAQELLKNPFYEDLVTNTSYTIVKNNKTINDSELSVSMISQPILIKAIQELKQENDLLRQALCVLDKINSTGVC